MAAVPGYMRPVMFLLVAALILGGGGSPSPRSELLLQLIAALCVLMALIGPWRLPARASAPQSAWLMAALLIIVPAIQLIPLPPQIWQGLNGRELAIQSLELSGAAGDWQTLSLFSGRTLAGLLALLPAAAMLLLISAVSLKDRRWITPVLAVVATLSIVLGAFQLAGGATSPLRFYAYSNPGFLNGFQANRNAQADILLIGFVASIAALANFGMSARLASSAVPTLLAIASSAVFILAIVLTGSRAGIALIPVAAAFAGFIWIGWSKRLLRAGAIGAAAGLFAALLLRGNTALRTAAERFMQTSDQRSELWPDAWFAIGQYWPMGAGIGSAGPVLQTVERLEVVDTTSPNRVHNDYLEFVLEGGILSVCVLTLIAAIIVWKSVQRIRSSRPEERNEIFLAIATLCILALHSIVDYPLRSMSLAMIAAVAGGIILSRTDRKLEL